MKISKKAVVLNIALVLAVVMILGCFTAAISIVEQYAKEDCFTKIEEATAHIIDMFNHAMFQNQEQLELFAGIIAANNSASEELLMAYMENFCETQSFSSVCIHWKNGDSLYHGNHPHGIFPASFDAELRKLPYISDAHALGESRSQQFVYQAVPIVRDDETVAVLYGFISLDTFPSFISSTAYGGECEFYILNGDNGDFLMDEYHRTDGSTDVELPLGNLFDGSMGDRETKPGYSMDNMKDSLRMGRSCYMIFRSQRTGQWYYTYSKPIGINNWAMQITIDEPTAFATYYNIRDTVLSLMIAMLVLCLVIVVLLAVRSRRKLVQERTRRELESWNLHKTEYTSAVQAALISAHNNPDFVAQALKLVARELQAETSLLLVFSEKIIRDVYFWPSQDKTQTRKLLNLNIQDAFPMLYDAVLAGETVFCGPEEIEKLEEPARTLFRELDIRSLMLVPVSDPMGVCRGGLVTVNMEGENWNAEMLECVNRDFFMAITNLESHNIIKKMGTIDYMTGVKNRNSYESELMEYESVQGENLWCVYVDANGLHELNNSQGHKAGDQMLRTVANTMKKVFGADFTYRLGGDEFIAFKLNSTHQEMMNCKYRITNEMNRKGYSVSVGFEVAERNENGIFDVEALSTRAESIMYQEKQKYYERNHLSTERTEHLKPTV